jgi:sulfate adenylyltransferase subunit 2
MSTPQPLRPAPAQLASGAAAPFDAATAIPRGPASHLDRLEAESIHIFREVAAQFRNPVLLYSIGKDSTVLLHLMKKAFAPARPPIPLLHIDSTFEFRQTYEFRDRVPSRLDVELRVHINEDGVKAGINPFDHGAAVYTDVMRTQGLLQALARGGYDCAIGGARRDEEKSRAKERVFSFRDAHQRWDPKRQRPEFWDLYNGRIHKGESVRAFPLSNWTELDVWLYILREGIELPPLYFAEERPIVERDGVLIMVDDERMPLKPNETPMHKRVRFRTLGCYPLTGGIESDADTLEKIVAEMLTVTTSERQGRVIDHDPSASMEKKKREGYF